MNCPFCAEPLADDSQFCPKCGTRLGVGYAAAPGSIPPPFGMGEQKTSGKAIASLICGIFAWLFPVSLAAVILGHISLSEIRKSAGRIRGHGMAVAGLVLGYLGIAFIPFILIIAAIAIPNLLRARMAANEASSVGSLRTYFTSIDTYATQCPERGYPASPAQLGPGRGDCEHANLVDGLLGSASPLKAGYVFTYVPGPADEWGRIKSYMISADPITPNTTGSRHFFIDETGVIRSEQTGPASPDSPPLR